VEILFIFAPEMEEKEIKLIETASTIFMRFGIKSVNMDDMARHLGISKKTLYLFVKDKEDLVAKAVTAFCNKEDCEIKAISKKGLNAIDENLEIMKWVLDVLQNIHPSVNYDIQKYHPSVHHDMMLNRQRAIFDCTYLNMKKGQREGLYRKDLNADVIAKMYISRIDVIFDQNLFPQSQFKLPEIYSEFFKYHIRGIASSKGLEYLTEKMKSIKI
jgi:TetR/AcrR family transcriptional regulator, cholesterol catabolism regulator